MATPKKKFHEVVSEELALESAGITFDLHPSSASVIQTLLGILKKGDMKPEHAHEIARQHSKLPDLLGNAREPVLAAMAAETLKDLAGRQDVKKEAIPCVNKPGNIGSAYCETH